MELGDRKNEILRLVVNGYVETGEPVGSKAIAEKLGGVSSATIRNDMADLEKVGLLEQPHTSAGRIPTIAAYRLFVDKLMVRHPLPDEVRSQVVAELKNGSDSAEALLERAGKLLAKMTECASVAITPYIKGRRLLKLNLLVADRCVYVVVAMTSEGTSNPKMCRTKNAVSEDELRFLSKVINDRFADREINEMLADDMARLCAELELSGDGNVICSTALAALSDFDNASVYIGGVSQLMHKADMMMANQIVELFDRRDSISSVLRRIHGNDALVLLGNETEDERLADAAVIGCGYNSPGGEGSLALIGPVRLNYNNAMESVNIVAKALSDIMNSEER